MSLQCPLLFHFHFVQSVFHCIISVTYWIMRVYYYDITVYLVIPFNDVRVLNVFINIPYFVISVNSCCIVPYCDSTISYFEIMLPCRFIRNHLFYHCSLLWNHSVLLWYQSIILSQSSTLSCQHSVILSQHNVLLYHHKVILWCHRDILWTKFFCYDITAP